MMRDDPSDTLIDLIRRTPVLPIDVKTAQTEGDLPTIAYPRGVTGWQRAATAAVPKLREGTSPRPSRRSRRLSSRGCSLRQVADRLEASISLILHQPPRGGGIESLALWEARPHRIPLADFIFSAVQFLNSSWGQKWPVSTAEIALAQGGNRGL